MSTEVVPAAESAHAETLDLLRTNPVLFAEHVLRHELTGDAIRLGPIQREWYRLFLDHDKILLWAPPGSGKTSLIATALPLWILGNNPQARIAILSNTIGQATKTVRAIKNHIETNEAVRGVFPWLVPSDKWTDSLFEVKRDVISRSPSVQAIGIGSSFQGDRIDYLIADDLMDYEVTRTPERRNEMWYWYASNVPNRLWKGAKQVHIFNAWHEDDYAHRLAKMRAFQWRVYPICDKDGTPRFLEMFPPELIEEIRQNNTEWEFARKYMCVLVNEEDARIKPSFIEIGKALARQHGFTLQHRLDVIPAGAIVVTGVDVGIGHERHHDQTALVTIVRLPNGIVYVVGIEVGRWSGPEIRDRIIDVHDRYRSIVGCESIQAQRWMLQMVTEKRADVPIRPFETRAEKKAHPQWGIEAIGVRLQNGAIGLPDHPDLRPLESDLVMYRPDSHVGDSLMGFWIAAEVARDISLGMDDGPDVILIGGRQ